MTAAITVPAGFRDDFELYCARSRMTEWEKEGVRDKVRADFAAWGPVITRTAAIYRFIDERWRATLHYVDFPPVRYAEGFLASHGWFPEDPEMFTKCGQLLIFGLCMDVAAARSTEAAAIAEAA
jgi:hypothetical protein